MLKYEEVITAIQHDESLEEDDREMIVTRVTLLDRRPENDLNDVVNLKKSGAEALW